MKTFMGYGKRTLWTLLLTLLFFGIRAPGPALGANDSNKTIQEIKNSYLCPDTHVTLAQVERFGLECATYDAVIKALKRMISSGWTSQQIKETFKLFATGKNASAAKIPGARACGSGARARLEFFLAGDCPLAREWVLRSLSYLVKSLSKNLDWTPYYILSIKSTGAIDSPRGSKELDDALRGICVREKYGTDRWLTYYTCVVSGQSSWEDCAFSAGLDSKKIAACVLDEAPALAFKDIGKGMDYDVEASPSFVINCESKYVGNVPPVALKALMCEQFGAIMPQGCLPKKK